MFFLVYELSNSILIPSDEQIDMNSLKYSFLFWKTEQSKPIFSKTPPFLQGIQLQTEARQLYKIAWVPKFNRHARIAPLRGRGLLWCGNCQTT